MLELLLAGSGADMAEPGSIGADVLDGGVVGCMAAFSSGVMLAWSLGVMAAVEAAAGCWALSSLLWLQAPRAAIMAAARAIREMFMDVLHPVCGLGRTIQTCATRSWRASANRSMEFVHETFVQVERLSRR
ncbi:hypothetical protein [Oleiagrimonas citrea]|uniref:hypothetical protein n=1 Tax=Oleiagrimonas citrea TaxID=1665687 RepID=UPI00196685CB|nr:hypothetical protein [Oleiagrimonas citrea]